MSSPIDRRRFLRDTAALLGGSALAGAASAGPAIEPVTASGAAASGKLRLSLAAYSFRDSLAPKKGKPTMTLEQFVDYCAARKLEGTELTSYYFPNPVTDDFLKSLRKRVADAGLEVSGGAIAQDFCQKPGPKLDADIAHTEAWIHRYAALGAPAIRVFAGNVPKGDTEAAAIERCARTLDRLLPIAEKAGTKLALENHGGITAKAATLMKIVGAVKGKAFGINFDSGNFRVGPDPYAELALIAPRAINAQIKVDMYRDNSKSAEPADIPRIVKILRDAGYSGWIALEYEAKEDPFTAIPRHLETLRAAIG